MIDKKDYVFYIVAGIIIVLSIYSILGCLGLLPQAVYQLCQNISLETAQLRGCCEDRDMNDPTSWLFGTRSCDKYRVVNGDEIK